LRLGVEQGGFNSGFGETVALKQRPQLRHGGARTGRIHTRKQWSEVGIDVDLDTFRAFLAVRQTANGGALAHANHAVAAADAHQHERLAVHGGDREAMRANRRYVDENRLHALDLHGCCYHSLRS
jgi:hypothetical protein